MTLPRFVDLFGLSFLLGALPALSVVQLRLIREMEIERLSVYASSALTLGVIGAGSLVLGPFRGGWVAVGLVGLDAGAMLRWTALITAGGLAVMFGFRSASALFGLEESPLLRRLLPTDNRERLIFAALSVAAGLGEEMAYRGYAISTLGDIAGPGVAIVVTSVAFGVMHAYQGAIGVVRTAVIGAWLGWAFVACGSLWPPMAAHALLDVLAGIFLARWLVTGESAPHADPAGVEEHEGMPPPAS